MTTSASGASSAAAPLAAAADEQPGAGFRLLWVGQLASALGSQAQYVALPLWVLRTTGSEIASGAAFAVNTLPLIVLGPWSGVIADRFPRRRLLLCCELLAVAAVGIILAGATAFDSLAVVLAGSTLLSALNAVTVPAFQGLLREVVPAPALARATARFAALPGAAAVLGPPTGSALFLWYGLTPALLINALSFAVSAATLLPRRLLYRHRDPAADAGTGAVRPHLTLGWRTVRAEPRFRRLMLAETGYFVFGGGLSVMVIQSAARYADEGRSGWYLSAVGVAWLLVSAVLLPRWRPPPRRAMLAGAAVLPPAALAALAMDLAPTAAVLLSGLAAGCANALVVVGASIAWQEEVPVDRIGQIMALRRSVTNAGLAVSSVGLPFLGSVLSDGPVLVVGSLLTTGLVVLALAPGTQKDTAPRRGTTDGTKNTRTSPT